MGNIRALLIWPNSRNEVMGWGDLGAIAEPLALEYLGAGLKQAGHAVKILDMRLHPNSLHEVLASFEPHLVGVTAFSMHVPRVLEICKEVKKHAIDIGVIVGGHHATFCPEDFFTTDIDYVASGDGVDLIVDVADAIAQGQKCQRTSGLYCKGNDGSFSARSAQDNVVRVQTRKKFNAMVKPDRSLTKQDREKVFY